MSPFDRALTTSYLFNFNRNYVSDIAGYLSEVADFDHPTCIWCPRRG